MGFCYPDSVLNTGGGWDGWGYDFIVATKVARITTKLRRAQGIPAGLRWVQQKLAQPNYTGTTVSIGIVCSIFKRQRSGAYDRTLLANPFEKAVGKFRAVGKGSVAYEFDLAE